MSEYLIYTAQGETIAPNVDIIVENCQLLGRSFGKSKTEAINNLYEENQWIVQAGYVKSECMAVQVFPTESVGD